MGEEDSSLHSGPKSELGRAAAVHCFSDCDSGWGGGLESNLQAPVVWTKGGLESEVEESLEVGSLLPFTISHNKVVNVSEDIGIRSFKFGPFGGII
jgi:hypothetical protein